VCHIARHGADTATVWRGGGEREGWRPQAGGLDEQGVAVRYYPIDDRLIAIRCRPAAPVGPQVLQLVDHGDTAAGLNIIHDYDVGSDKAIRSNSDGTEYPCVCTYLYAWTESGMTLAARVVRNTASAEHDAPKNITFRTDFRCRADDSALTVIKYHSGPDSGSWMYIHAVTAVCTVLKRYCCQAMIRAPTPCQIELVSEPVMQQAEKARAGTQHDVAIEVGRRILPLVCVEIANKRANQRFPVDFEEDPLTDANFVHQILQNDLNPFSHSHLDSQS
jgi:hypothetical protein